jgi:hypothetical protein
VPSKVVILSFNTFPWFALRGTLVVVVVKLSTIEDTFTLFVSKEETRPVTLFKLVFKLEIVVSAAPRRLAIVPVVALLSIASNLASKSVCPARAPTISFSIASKRASMVA